MFEGFTSKNEREGNVLSWAKKKGYEVIHDDKDANVIVFGENHTNSENFFSQMELLEKRKPSHLILEAFPAGKEIDPSQLKKVWNLNDAGKEFGFDFGSIGQALFDRIKTNLQEEAQKNYDDYKKEGLLAKGDSVENEKKKIIGRFTMPKNADELLNLPFYRWHPNFSEALIDFAKKKSDPQLNGFLDELLESVIWKMMPKSRNGYNELFWTLHSAQKSGTKIIGMDNEEAKQKIIAIIKQREKRRKEGKDFNFTDEESLIIKEENKKRVNTMAETIASKTQNNESAFVVAGSIHVNEKEPENQIPFESKNIRYVSLEQDKDELDLIKSIMAEAEHVSKLTK